MPNVDRLRCYVAGLAELVAAPDAGEEQPIVQSASALMRDLVAVDDWLPDAFATPDERYYRQYLLYADPCERFSLVSFV